MGLAATGMLLRTRSIKVFGAAAGTGSEPGTVTTQAAPPVVETPALAAEVGDGRRWNAAARILISGLDVGFMTGFVGVGVGFVIAPSWYCCTTC